MIPCSVPILTLNSEKTLVRCLESVKNFDDIFLVDGNSTDGTHDIAKRYGVTVYKQVETDEPNVTITDFSAVRAAAYKRAQRDWILILDSDEYISEALKHEIEQAVMHNDTMTAYAFPYVMLLGNKQIRYSFNMPRADMRLYNKRSGIYLKEGKTVHEKFYLPETVRVVTFKNDFFNDIQPYRKALKKDAFYLSLSKKKILTKKTSLIRGEMMRAVILNFMRAFHILARSIAVYARHGFKESLPPAHVWRFMRYHFIISGYRLQQLMGKRI